MELKKMLEELAELEKASAKLQEIKRIMHNDGSIDIIEQITHLQNNTQVNNINKLNKELERIEGKIEDIQCDFSNHYDEAQEAIRCLDNIVDYSDYADEAVTAIADLRIELNQFAKDEVGKWVEDGAVQVTNDENGKAVKIEDITAKKTTAQK